MRAPRFHSRFCACLFALLMASIAFADKLKFVGTFTDERNNIEFRLNIDASRPNTAANYTVAGVIRAKDGDYTVSGTLYAKTGKLRAVIKRKSTGTLKDFEQPLDGQLDPSGNKLAAKCNLLSPMTKVAMAVGFDAYKVADSKDTSEEIKAFVRSGVRGLASPDMKVDDLAGTLTINSQTTKGEPVQRTVKFTPLPPAYAFGGKMTFTVDATSIPKDERTFLKITVMFIDNDAKTPYIEFDLSTGERSFSKVIHWNIDVDNGYQGVAFALRGNGPITSYSVKKLKKSDFDRMNAQYNQTMVGATVTGVSLTGGSAGTGSGSTTTGVATSGSTGAGTTGGRTGGTAATGSVATGAGTAGTNASSTVGMRSTSVKGDVEIRLPTSTDYQPLTANVGLVAGTMIDVGPESSATFQLADGSNITLQAGTNIKIEEMVSSGGRARAVVRMMTGTIIFRHLASQQIIKGDFVLLAAEATVSRRGTDFTMSYDPKTGAMRIDLREGEVDFEPGHGLSKMKLVAPTTVTYKVNQAPAQRKS